MIPRVQTEPPRPDVPATPAAEATPFSWSTQPPRRNERRIPRNRLIVIGLVVGAAIGSGLGILDTMRRHNPRPPDLRTLLVPAPAGTRPCGTDDVMLPGTELAQAAAFSGDAASLLGDTRIRSAALRCWTMPRGTATGIELLSFHVILLRLADSAQAEQVMARYGPAQLQAVGATDIADIPGVPQGRSFTLPGTASPRRFAVAHRAETLFVMFGPVSPSFDAAAVNQVAAQQYERL